MQPHAPVADFDDGNNNEADDEINLEGSDNEGSESENAEIVGGLGQQRQPERVVVRSIACEQ